MKKALFLMVSVAILGLLFAGCSEIANITAPGFTETEGVATLNREVTDDPDFSESYPLFAGQDIEVGTVEVWNDDSTLYVKYIVESPWRLTETHLHVAIDLSAIPQTKKNNPIPGQFDYKMEHNHVTNYTYTIPMLSTDGELYIAAHAVVSDSSQYAGNGTMYAARIGGLYQLDVVQGTYQLLKTITGGIADVNSGNTYINALAFDPFSYKLYFTNPRAVNVSPSPLWSYDIYTGALEKIVDLPGSVVGASFYDGAYYYIAEGTNELKKVDVNSSDHEPQVVCSGFGSASDFTFGDFVISSTGMLYGSTRITPQIFFSMDIMDCSGTYKVFESSNALDLQLAFGSNRMLYGIKNAGGYSYVIDIETGEATSLSFTFSGVMDMASGELGIGLTESAWAATELGQIPFDGKNWATYITYTVHEWIHVEEIEIPSNVADNWKCSQALLEGELYRIDASETFTYNSAGDWADAEYYLLGGEVVKGDIEGSAPYVLDISIDEASILDDNINWGAYNEAHKYSVFWNGTGSPACFSIYDSQHSDNNGSLYVDIYRWE